MEYEVNAKNDNSFNNLVDKSLSQDTSLMSFDTYEFLVDFQEKKEQIKNLLKHKRLQSAIFDLSFFNLDVGLNQKSIIKSKSMVDLYSIKRSSVKWRE